MTQAMTRALRRTKRKRAPEYVPPYFWHRFYVWMTIYVLTNAILITAADVLINHYTDWGGFNFWWKQVLALVFVVPYARQTERVRKRWVRHVFTELTEKALAHIDKGSTSGEQAVNLSFTLRELSDYFYTYTHRVLNPRGLSIRLIPWDGDGTKITVYQRGRSGHEFTIFHD